jgi:hypothetical protein
VAVDAAALTVQPTSTFGTTVPAFHVTGGDDSQDAVLAGDYRRVRENAPAIGHQRRLV